jgi:hypothetical protein
MTESSTSSVSGVADGSARLHAACIVIDACALIL